MGTTQLEVPFKAKGRANPTAPWDMEKHWNRVPREVVTSKVRLNQALSNPTELLGSLSITGELNWMAIKDLLQIK